MSVIKRHFAEVCMSLPLMVGSMSEYLERFRTPRWIFVLHSSSRTDQRLSEANGAHGVRGYSVGSMLVTMRDLLGQGGLRSRLLACDIAKEEVEYVHPKLAWSKGALQEPVEYVASKGHGLPVKA